MSKKKTKNTVSEVTGAARKKLADQNVQQGLLAAAGVVAGLVISNMVAKHSRKKMLSDVRARERARLGVRRIWQG